MAEGAMRDEHEATVDTAAGEPASGMGLVTIARMSGTEASLAAAKLEAEGVPCFVADTNIAIADPLVFPNVPVQVRARDAARARAILDQPAAAAAAGDGEYADEAWRCGKCHRKTVELVPMTAAWRWMATAFWGLIALMIVLRVSGIGLWSIAGGAARPIEAGWAVVVCTLALLLVFRRREQQCTSCGHRWAKT